MKKLLFCLFSLCFLVAALSGQVLSAPAAYYHGTPGDRRIALTFDDGPHPRYTPRILDILAEEGVSATFFFIGQNVEFYPDTARAVLEAGHEIGNHTYSHPHLRRIKKETLLGEIDRADTVLHGIGCGATPLFRPPEGFLDTDYSRILDTAQKTAVLWSIDTRDWAHTPSADIVKQVEAGLAGGDIILFHDYISGENTTLAALKKLIPALKERGYQFVTVSELLWGEGDIPSGGQ